MMACGSFTFTQNYYSTAKNKDFEFVVKKQNRNSIFFNQKLSHKMYDEFNSKLH